MARMIKEDEYAERRNEFIDAAQQLIYTKGYENMSIQDILDRLHISKGAFYHYFASKKDLVDALLLRIVDQSEKMLRTIVDDPQLSAPEKIERFFAASYQWKTSQKDFILQLMRGWYQDDNALVRQTLNTNTRARLSPLLNELVQQGVRERLLRPAYPAQAAEIMLNMLFGLGDTLSRYLMADELCETDQEFAQGMVSAYTDLIEHALGAAPGSLHLMDAGVLREWSIQQVAMQPGQQV